MFTPRINKYSKPLYARWQQYFVFSQISMFLFSLKCAISPTVSNRTPCSICFLAGTLQLIYAFNIIRVQFVKTVIHVKLENFKRGRYPSLHLGKEGDFARNHSAAFISPISVQMSAEILENDDIFPPVNGLTLFLWYKNIVFLYMVDTLLT